MKKKRILVISDGHIGAVCGLTPPAYQTNLTPGNTDEDGKAYGFWEKAAQTQREIWSFFTAEIDRGRPFDTGADEDCELMVCDKYPVDEIRGQLCLEANGVVFNFRHHIGGTTVPYSVHTAPTKQRIFNILAADQDQQVRADIIVRSHVHKYQFEETRSGASLVTPGLQAWSKYGDRVVDGEIDVGICWFDVYENGEWELYKALLDIEYVKPTPISI